jgi:hypothetical protein
MSDVAARNKRNRRAGARWQSDLRDGLRAEGFDVERLVLTGKEDEGDLVIRDPQRKGRSSLYLVIEAKAGEMKPSEFVREAATEAEHFRAHRGLPAEHVSGVAVVKQRGKNWKDAYVLTTLRDYLGLDS